MVIELRENLVGHSQERLTAWVKFCNKNESCEMKIENTLSLCGIDEKIKEELVYVKSIVDFSNKSKETIANAYEKIKSLRRLREFQ